MSVTRLELLAKKYGPFARFIPDGNEDDGLDGAIDESNKADLKNNPEFDKVQQQADQERANATRAREESAEKTTQLEEANSTVASLQQQLEEARVDASKAGIDLDKLDEGDFSDTDVELVRHIKALGKKVKTVESKNKALEETADKFKTNEAKKAAASEKDRAYQDLLSDMDADYGPENRNEAVKTFEAKVAAGEVKGGPAKATRILEKCYRDAAKASAATGKKKGVGLDPGSGGGSGITLSGLELTEGTLDEVAAQASKTKSNSS